MGQTLCLVCTTISMRNRRQFEGGASDERPDRREVLRRGVAVAGPPDVLSRNWTVDPANYYFRMNPTFETRSRNYDWINRINAVGPGVRLPHIRVYSIIEVL